jgi:hypothetical protein
MYGASICRLRFRLLDARRELEEVSAALLREAPLARATGDFTRASDLLVRKVELEAEVASLSRLAASGHYGLCIRRKPEDDG